MKQPEQYPRRVLMAVTGLSPQILTETLYFLAVKAKPAFIPTEICMLTTEEGHDRARLTLLSAEPGWFRRLCEDYRLPDIQFGLEHIHVVKDQSGNPLTDIRSVDDNGHAADQITNLIRQFTNDGDAALHVSIAGGRKTMGFYAGYALSLYGRPQDRLSHVLVSPPYEGNREFFYPRPASDVIYTDDRPGRPLNSSEAVVDLADIPFVRLRDGLPEALLQGDARFSEAVSGVQGCMGTVQVRVDAAQRKVCVNQHCFTLKPADFAFYYWMLWRQSQGMEWIHRAGGGLVSNGLDEHGLAAEFLQCCAQVLGEFDPQYGKAEAALKDGMEKEYFQQRKSKTNSAINKKMGKFKAAPYLVQSEGRRNEQWYGINLPANAITFVQ